MSGPIVPVIAAAPVGVEATRAAGAEEPAAVGVVPDPTAALPAAGSGVSPAPPAGPARRRRRSAVHLLILEGLIATSAALILLAAIPGIDQLAGGPAASEQAGPGASGATASGRTGLTPIMVAMGPDADCGACHLSPDGGIGVTKIPLMAHPLDGWRDCTACHADDRLVKTAPGHNSLHKGDCLVCHEAPLMTGSPPPRPHPLVQGQACLSCHGTHKAPLPSGMAGRENCWICHSGTEFQGLFGSPAPSAGSSSP